MVVTFLVLVLLIWGISKAWRFFLETSDDIRLIQSLEPWYWFIFLNLILTLISSNFDFQYITLALVLQLALSAWFAVSVRWIIRSCHHATVISHPSWFVKGKNVKFCYRCGTRLPKDFHANAVRDSSWQNFFFQVPPHLFEYISFWVTQCVMVLIVLFFVLKFLKFPESQHWAALGAVTLVVLLPPAIYFFGRFRKYLSETKGMVWWADLKGSFVVWAVVVVLLWGIFHWF